MKRCPNCYNKTITIYDLYKLSVKKKLICSECYSEIKFKNSYYVYMAISSICIIFIAISNYPILIKAILILIIAFIPMLISKTYCYKNVNR